MIDWLRRATTHAKPAAPTRHVIRVGEEELPLVVRRLRHARRMTLRLSSDGSEVRISIPTWGRVGDAIAFAEDRSAWLARQIATLPRTSELGPGTRLHVRGELHEIVWDETAKRRPLACDGRIVVGGPQEAISARIQNWLETEALRLCGEDLAHYCLRAGRPAPAIAISRAKRRWGSCAVNGSIRINWRLVMAPDFVRRSVVAHEVAHLAHFDHSPAFHAHLDMLYEGDIADANRWLKANGRSLYRVFA